MATQSIAPEMDFGTRLQAARRRTGLDLRAVAANVPGVSMSALAKWERNEREPGAFRLARLAAFYGVDVRWLLDGAAITTPEVRTLAGVRPHQLSMFDTSPAVVVPPPFVPRRLLAA